MRGIDFRPQLLNLVLHPDAALRQGSEEEIEVDVEQRKETEHTQTDLLNLIFGKLLLIHFLEGRGAGVAADFAADVAKLALRL